ncbi:MAG: DUF4279 domain-containing protein [Lachnospiraceae bacterium]|nr:DUF4279 domain-containing protein [Lachnospiraceae bacterium]
MNIFAEFVIINNEKPLDDIINIIDMDYSSKTDKGETFFWGSCKQHCRVQEYYDVSYFFEEDVECEIETLLMSMYKRLNIYKEQLIDYITSNDTEIIVRISFDYNDNPVISIPNYFLKFIADLEGEIEFDI